VIDHRRILQRLRNNRLERPLAVFLAEAIGAENAWGPAIIGVTILLVTTVSLGYA